MPFEQPDDHQDPSNSTSDLESGESRYRDLLDSAEGEGDKGLTENARQTLFEYGQGFNEERLLQFLLDLGAKDPEDFINDEENIKNRLNPTDSIPGKEGRGHEFRKAQIDRLYEEAKKQLGLS